MSWAWKTRACVPSLPPQLLRAYNAERLLLIKCLQVVLLKGEPRSLLPEVAGA